MASKKIAIIGSHFVGKTTVIKNISKHLKNSGYNVGIINEVVRDCPYPVNEMTTLEAQDWILEEQKRREAEMNNKYDIILMDRGLIDNFAYWKRVAEKILTDEKLLEKEKEVFEHSKNYDLLIFLHPFDNTKIEDDNFRSIDPNWRKEMHERISQIVEKFRTAYNTPVFIVNGSKRNVTEKVKDIITKNIL